VVGFVDVLVNARMVQASVNPVDTEIGEDEEEWVLGPVVPACWAFGCCIIQLRVAAYFSQKPGHGQDCHYGEGDVGLLHLELDLILEVSRVVEGRLVEDEEVGQSGEKEVYKYTE
jgi:hypothetical protein